MTTILGDYGEMDERAGGKARALAAAARAGLPIPPFFVILDGDDPRFRDELRRAVDRLCPTGELVAVRSSSRDEDGAERSFAGQLKSFLDVGPADVPERITAVRASAAADPVQAYRRQHGLAGPGSTPAVIVQRMVRARAAGVAFSADPVSGRRGVAIVGAVRGLGSALVDGARDADTWEVDRVGAIAQRYAAVKRRTHVADSCHPDDARPVDVPDPEAGQPSLSDDEVRAVADLARRSARHFGRPQDIEWAYEGDRLLLLQTRPITSLATRADPDGALAIWDNSNIVESYGGITTPLTFSFASEIYGHVYRQFCRLMGVGERVIARNDETFRNMLGLVRGRLYYNLLNWYRVLALLPGFSLNRRFMEQMMGVSQPLPAEQCDEIARSAKKTRLADSIHLLRTGAGLLASHFMLEARIRVFRRRLDDALAAPEPPLADRRPDELVADFRELRQRLLLTWDAPLVNDFFAMVFYGLLRRAAAAWCGDSDGSLPNDLIGGEGGMISAEPARRLQHLAELAAARPPLVERLTGGTIGEVRSEMQHAPEFRSALEAYLETFGDRTINELKLENATLHDDPLPLFRSIASLASRIAGEQSSVLAARGSEPTGGRLRHAARQRVRETLRRHPVRRLAFAWILRNASARVRDRENLRLDRTRLFGRVRRIFVELGRRWHAENLLDDPRDIFYLEVDEAIAFVEGRATATSLRALAAVRREEFLAYEAMLPPDSRFETRGMVYVGHDFRNASAAAPAAGEERRGLGCSPGRVRGPVRNVTDPRRVDLRVRAVLVAEHTDPGWIMVFPSALGLLVERGSLLSHAAIVARELGIPAVVSIPGLTGWLRDGDWVEFDGASGVIRRIAREEQDHDCAGAA